MSQQYFEPHRIIDENGERIEMVAVDYSPEEKIKNEVSRYIRNQRNNLLIEIVDKMNAVRWETLSENEKQVWRDYRQALLDVPQQAGFPETIIWPTAPSA